MEISREVVLVREEENDQCGVTLAIGTTEIDLEPDEARRLALGLIRSADDAEGHEAERLGIETDRIATRRFGWEDDAAEASLRGGIEL